MLTNKLNIISAAVPTATKQEAELIAVLKSSDASLKDKWDACRNLALVGTDEAVGTLAGMLGEDERVSHYARYALEPIPSPKVDQALRDALGKVKGTPLVGVIGSIGVRRDAKAVDSLVKFLSDSNPQVAQAAARALGSIGTGGAAEALLRALPDAPEKNQLDVCEGLFRCAEELQANGWVAEAREIYDRLCEIRAPHQVRSAALRGAVLTRGDDGLPMLVKALHGDDFTQVAAAVRTAQEMPGSLVSEVLAAELSKLDADRQIVVIQTLGKRGDSVAVSALVAAAKKGDNNVRIEAIRSLAEIGDDKAAPALKELAKDSDAEVAKAAKESLVVF